MFINIVHTFETTIEKGIEGVELRILEVKYFLHYLSSESNIIINTRMNKQFSLPSLKVTNGISWDKKKFPKGSPMEKYGA